MQVFQTITRLIPNFGDRVDDPPAAPEAQQALTVIFSDMLGQSARFIQPVLFRSGRLIVYAEASIWGQHIQHRQLTLLERCHAVKLHVTSVKVKVRPGRSLTNRDKEPRVSSYDAEVASAHIEKLAMQTDKPELQQTLDRLAKRIRENHRPAE